jgi:signal transduction histidine kinase
MRVRLRDALAEIRGFTQTLESKVEERTRALKEAEQKLQQNVRLASLGQLAASVAHEINNPVSGVLNLSMLMQRILRDDGIPPGREAEFKRYLSQVTTETARIGRIVSDLLAFSRRGKPQRSPQDVNRLIRATLSLVDHKLKLATIALHTELAPDLPPVDCDGSQIQQVVLNLVLNAAEAVQSKGAGSITVRSGLSPGGRNVWFSVEDTGEGIPDAILPRIFDPFFTTKPEGKGVGLGLSVSYGIIHAHNGEIDVASHPGVGSVFAVTLPREPVGAAL